MSRKPTILIFLLAGITIIAYCLPWVSTANHGLSLGGYDLAEWASLHPNARISNPPLLTSLLLRVSLISLSLIISVQVALKSGFVALIVGAATAVILLPPPEFFTLYREDMNYRQQFFLVTLTFVCSIAVFRGRHSRFERPFMILIALIGGVSSIWGLGESLVLMRGFGLPAYVGGGAVLTGLSFGLIAMVEIASNKQGSARLPCSQS